MKFHMSNGEAKPCTAQPGNCRISGDGKHYESPEEAYKDNYGKDTLNTLHKDKGKFKNNAIRTVGAVALAASFMGALSGCSSADASKIEANVNSTPYSVSVSTAHSNFESFHGSVTTPDLKKSNFDYCAGNMSTMNQPITCKTVDGKYTVNGITRMDYNGDNNNNFIKNNAIINLTNVSVKDNSTGKSHLLNYEGAGGMNYFLAKTSAGN